MSLVFCLFWWYYGMSDLTSPFCNTANRWSHQTQSWRRTNICWPFCRGPSPTIYLFNSTSYRLLPCFGAWGLKKKAEINGWQVSVLLNKWHHNVCCCVWVHFVYLFFGFRHYFSSSFNCCSKESFWQTERRANEVGQVYWQEKPSDSTHTMNKCLFAPLCTLVCIYTHSWSSHLHIAAGLWQSSS